MPPTSAARTVGFVSALGLLAAMAAAPRPSAADILPMGQAGVAVTAEFDWGPLAKRLARPATAKADDTWETLATREAGDVRWAPTVKALNGGSERPVTTEGATWLPPREVAFGSDVVWYSAFIDSSKFGIDSDVSRTGFVRLDPAAASVRVFGTVSVALVKHATIDDAALAAALSHKKVRDALKAGGDKALVLAAPFEVTDSVPERSPVRSIVQRWRCKGVEGTNLELTLVSEESRNASGRALSAGEAAMGALRTEWIAGLLAVIVLSVGMLALTRRRRRRAQPA